MPEVLPQPKIGSPVDQVYRRSISSAANDLPPAPDYKTGLPTDEEVLASTKKNVLNPPAEEKKLSVVGSTIVEEQKLDEEGNHIAEEPPVIEVIKPVVEEKKVVTEGKVDQFDLDSIDENDRNLLKELYPEEKENADSDGKSKENEEVVKDPKKISAEIEERYRPTVEKATEYDAVLSNPLTKAFIEFVKSGKTDPLAFAKEVGFVNVESMTEREIIDYECAQAGLTPEQTEIEHDSFEQMTPLQKKKHIASTKAELTQKRDEKLKTFTSGNERDQLFMKEAAKVGLTQLNDLIPKMENKKYEGLLITPEMAKTIHQYVSSNPVPVYNDDKKFIGYDIKESISNAVYSQFRPQLKKALVELGRSLGADKALSARIRPNKKIATSSVVPITKETPNEVLDKMADKRWEKLGVKTNNKK